MNTVTPSEIAAVQTVADQTLSDEATQQAQAVLDKAQTTAAEDAPAVLRFIPLSRLRISRRNVRKTRTDSPEQLAESIARVGLLQNLIVIVDGEDYGVVGGRRRLQALRLLVKQKRLSMDQIIPCLEVPDDSAVTVSLTENVQREAMHPADQFEAFKALVNEGRPIEDIAADFGVTPLVVQRRLKLARVSPRLLADYRADQVTLEQLMALAITDDHTAQEAAYYEAPQWERDAIALRRRLTDTEVDASRSALTRFVGIENYTAAGGGLRRDLFAEQDSGVYLTDAGLLNRLAMAKLETVTAQIKTEGWKWVDAMPTLGYSELSAFRRAAQGEREPTARERKRIAKLEAEQARIEEALFAAEEAEDAAAAPLYEQGEQVGQALEALYASLLAYAPETMAQAGAIVTLDRDGDLVVHRGLVRPEDAKAATQAQKAVAGGEHDGTDGNADDDSAEGNGTKPGKTVSEKLARNLSAHRSAALQLELARKPDVTLVALTHRLALQVFYRGYGVQSLVQIEARQQGDLSRHAANLEGGKSVIEFDALRSAWRERLPAEAEELFESLLAYKRADLLALLAVCTAATLDAVTSSEHDRRADPLSRAVKLDMSAYWAASAENYFDHVSKGQILDAFKVFKPGEVNRVAGYKKAAMAAEAGQYAVAAKWLPAMLTVAD
ncbi:ParB/RepB/Spo0J family partition protein [Pusillimonas noertemannii]|uniref:ParB family protein n=1 Tax=Pusillimonas noertemannii TaxID=305977 RepID=A0A2U1CMB8_9BURK|nr:ParB/RepB/Spo0J family partition protein [Pusillimonas noertemannii]NYT68847.1 ParB/RepB/Spo0J family partition protein [Pusillimonas noertemannii]PVY62132.1 ParB family protein [Pusillimonas noertemannii]TFL10877.1 ParB/RepB/Spo0J family partition protein [Pusillimonas noertemannii]